MTRPMSLGTKRNARVRCAIYTRKSSEEGLDQEFNSLLAQREACEAFITSQRHECRSALKFNPLSASNRDPSLALGQACPGSE